MAIPVVEKSRKIREWAQKDISDFDKQLLTIHGLMHPRAYIERLYVSREEGGRGMRMLELAHKSEIISIAKYLMKTELAKEILRKHQALTTTKSITNNAIDHTAKP